MSSSVSVTVDILDYNDNKPVFTGQSSSNVFTVDLLEDTTINDPVSFRLFFRELQFLYICFPVDKKSR